MAQEKKSQEKEYLIWINSSAVREGRNNIIPGSKSYDILARPPGEVATDMAELRYSLTEAFARHGGEIIYDGGGYLAKKHPAYHKPYLTVRMSSELAQQFADHAGVVAIEENTMGSATPDLPCPHAQSLIKELNAL